MHLPEEQIDIKKLIDIFEGAMMDVIDPDESQFLVKGVDFPFPLGVMLEPVRKEIRFTDYNRLHRVSEQQAALICNEANKTIFLGRFYAFTHQDTVMVTCEYDMSYEKGIVPFQLIRNFRLFERAAGRGVQEYFMDYLRE